jgi:guanylate kinase
LYDLLLSTDTSRLARDGEVDGVDYHFVTRATFERDIADNRFVEYGLWEKTFYGTTLNSVRQVINGGKICVLNLHPQVSNDVLQILKYQTSLELVNLTVG